MLVGNVSGPELAESRQAHGDQAIEKAGLVGGQVQFQQLAGHGVQRFTRAFASLEHLQKPAFRLAVARQAGNCVLKVTAAISDRGGTPPCMQNEFRIADNFIDGRLIVGAENRPTDEV